MAGAVGPALRVVFGAEALTEIVTAAAVGDQTKVPCADGEVALAFLLEQGHQLGDKLREDLAHKRMLGFHQRDHNRDMTH